MSEPPSSPQSENAPPSTLSRTLLVLLAAASLVTTLLILLLVFGRAAPTPTPADQPGMAVTGGPGLFEQPIPVGEFELTDRHGEPFGSDDLEGKVSVIDFFFTQCASICPRLSYEMSQLQDRLDEHADWGRIRLVSISVDPENDTPAALREYAEQYDAHPTQWRFLTGEREPIWRLIREGFRQSVGPNPGDPGMPIYHSQQFILLDSQVRIRGVYDAFSEEEREELVRDLDRLLGGPGAGDAGDARTEGG